MIKTINVKEECGIESALNRIDNEIKYAKYEGTGVLIIIHGYGSHGQGGVIKDEIRNMLETLKKYKKIEEYIPGEKWGEEYPERKQIVKQFPVLIYNEQLINLNNGVTIVLLKK